MERYFVEQGYLIPSFHQSYWIGLNTTVPGTNNRDNWTWIDYAEPPSDLTYIAWGDDQPDNAEGPAACAAASHEMAGGDPSVWQWDDTSCGANHVAICRLTREAAARFCTHCSHARHLLCLHASSPCSAFL